MVIVGTWNTVFSGDLLGLPALICLSHNKHIPSILHSLDQDDLGPGDDTAEMFFLEKLLKFGFISFGDNKSIHPGSQSPRNLLLETSDRSNLSGQVDFTGNGGSMVN